MIIAEREDQYWATRVKWDDMASLIITKWNIGYAITAINWSKGYWLILFSKGTANGQKESWETTFTLLSN